MEGVTYEDIADGCYIPSARIADMDLNHVEASLCFPNYPRFCGQLFSRGAMTSSSAKLCVEAYNDWMVDEWCERPRPADPAVRRPPVGRRARRRRRSAAMRRAA